MTDEELDLIIKAADVDRDYHISYEEFLQIFRATESTFRREPARRQPQLLNRRGAQRVVLGAKGRSRWHILFVTVLSVWYKGDYIIIGCMRRDR